ncbi:MULTISPECIES: HEPN domain-containing protein [Vibrio]|nr:MULTISPECIES: HEPN domain-containing protein [Vibrio]KJR21415.1 hypothetical protein UF06_21485 [Vibrio sp. S234-5]MBE4602567.1 hypothetical protein [Vibrio navarrensis]
MKIQVPNKIYPLFDKLFKEYQNEYILYIKEPLEYLKDSIFLLGGSIGCSSEEEHLEIERKIQNKIPVFTQLFKNEKTISTTEEISQLLMKSNQLYCLESEVIHVVDRISYKSINKIISTQPFPDEDEQRNIIESITKELVCDLKKSFRKYKFKFPIYASGIKESMQLSPSIILIKEDDFSLNDGELNNYLQTRAFSPNSSVYIETNINSSYEYAKCKAIRSKDATISMLRAMLGGMFGFTNSRFLIDESDKQLHFMGFFLYGEKGDELGKCRNYQYHYNPEECRTFWEALNGEIKENKKLIDLLFSVPEKIITNVNFEKSVCSLIERSLRWLSDAINEDNFESKIMKLTISIESLINFHSDSKKENLGVERIKDTFVKRTMSINMNNEDIENKAKQLYKARSSIAHGSPLKTRFSFDVIQFTCETILLAIQLFSLYKKNGIDEIGYDRGLPEHIDNYGRYRNSTN